MATIVIIGDPQQVKLACRALLEGVDTPGLFSAEERACVPEFGRGMFAPIGDVLLCSVDSSDLAIARGVSSVPQAARPQLLRRAVFRLEGEYWTVEHGGIVLRLRDSKGLRYIAYLLRYPMQTHRALDVVLAVNNGGNPAPDEGRQLRAASCGPMLDNQALTQYRRRLAEVRQELDIAEADNDLGRIAKLHDEVEWLERQLEQAFSLGHRPRCAPSTSERARQTLTKCVRSAIRRIDHGNPELATHFDRHIKTGYLCGYESLLDSHQEILWEL